MSEPVSTPNSSPASSAAPTSATAGLPRSVMELLERAEREALRRRFLARLGKLGQRTVWVAASVCLLLLLLPALGLVGAGAWHSQVVPAAAALLLLLFSGTVFAAFLRAWRRRPNRLTVAKRVDQTCRLEGMLLTLVTAPPRDAERRSSTPHQDAFMQLVEQRVCAEMDREREWPAFGPPMRPWSHGWYALVVLLAVLLVGALIATGPLKLGPWSPLAEEIADDPDEADPLAARPDDDEQDAAMRSSEDDDNKEDEDSQSSASEDDEEESRRDDDTDEPEGEDEEESGGSGGDDGNQDDDSDGTGGDDEEESDAGDGESDDGDEGEDEEEEEMDESASVGDSTEQLPEQAPDDEEEDEGDDGESETEEEGDPQHPDDAESESDPEETESEEEELDEEQPRTDVPNHPEEAQDPEAPDMELPEPAELDPTELDLQPDEGDTREGQYDAYGFDPEGEVGDESVPLSELLSRTGPAGIAGQLARGMQPSDAALIEAYYRKLRELLREQGE